MKVLILLMILSSLTAHSQNQRYIDPVFKKVVFIPDIVYGKAVTQGGQKKSLKMDIYAPKDDTCSSRPLIIFSHGGFFQYGDKRELENECVEMAMAGYLCASINYRLIDVENDSFMVAKKAVIDAVFDIKAAIRFFYKEANEGNFYRIDTNNIFIGGYSAGAIASLHCAYASKLRDIRKMGGNELLNYVKINGGINGTSGNEGYSDNVKGVINISGALFHSNFVDSDEPILFSIHGTADKIVPYTKGIVNTTKIETEGSYLIHERATKVGLTNELKSIKDGGHFGFIKCKTCIVEMMRFLSQNISNL